jgi:hypothetical protein
MTGDLARSKAERSVGTNIVVADETRVVRDPEELDCLSYKSLVIVDRHPPVETGAHPMSDGTRCHVVEHDGRYFTDETTHFRLSWRFAPP